MDKMFIKDVVPKEKVLIVDDEAHVLKLMRDYLVSGGYDVHTATSGLEAIEKVKEVTPHIVFLDIIMPGMGGIETMQEIKKINPKIWVAMVTAVVDEELAKRVIQLGADDYIVKPIDLGFLRVYVLVRMIQLLN
jgi:CheY-like chemotaxis protein